MACLRRSMATIAASLRLTQPFHDLPVSRHPHNDVFTAYERAVRALRLPLYHMRLGKPRPKDFTSKAGSGDSLGVMKRQKPER